MEQKILKRYIFIPVLGGGEVVLMLSEEMALQKFVLNLTKNHFQSQVISAT